MDIGRSSSIVNFRFNSPQQSAGTMPAGPIASAFAFGNGATQPVRVRWYFAPPGAEVFPDWHIWGATDFCDQYEKCADVYGEIPDVSTYDKGRSPIGVTGKHFCGKLEQFQEVFPYDPRGQKLKRNADGVPLCCVAPARNAFVMTGGPTIPDFVLCAGKENPPFLTVTFHNVFGLALMDGLTFRIYPGRFNVPPFGPNPRTSGYRGNYVNPYTGLANDVAYRPEFGSLLAEWVNPYPSDFWDPPVTTYQQCDPTYLNTGNLFFYYVPLASVFGELTYSIS